MKARGSPSCALARSDVIASCPIFTACLIMAIFFSVSIYAVENILKAHVSVLFYPVSPVQAGIALPTNEGFVSV